MIWPSEVLKLNNLSGLLSLYPNLQLPLDQVGQQTFDGDERDFFAVVELDPLLTFVIFRDLLRPILVALDLPMLLCMG